MKLVPFLLTGFLTACASTKIAVIAESELVGEFCHSSIDAALCLELKPDHTYAENFSGDGTIVLGAHGEIPPSVPEPRGSGRWRLDGNRLVLSPMEGKRRILLIERVDHAVRLHESLGKYSRDYRR